MKFRTAFLTSAAAVAVSMPGTATAAVFTAPAANDTWGERRNPDNVNGLGDSLIARQDDGNIGKFTVPALQFDLSNVTLGANESVSAASIDLSATFVRNGNPLELTTFQYLSPFDEATATFRSLSTAADSVFGFQPGSDYDSTNLGSTVVTATGAVSIQLNQDGIDLVEAWIEGSTANNGFLLLGDGNGNDAQVNFFSAESSEDPQFGGGPDPVLNITTVPEPGSLALTAVGGLLMLRRRRR